MDRTYLPWNLATAMHGREPVSTCPRRRHNGHTILIYIYICNFNQPRIFCQSNEKKRRYDHKRTRSPDPSHHLWAPCSSKPKQGGRHGWHGEPLRDMSLKPPHVSASPSEGEVLRCPVHKTTDGMSRASPEASRRYSEEGRKRGDRLSSVFRWRGRRSSSPPTAVLASGGGEDRGSLAGG